MLTRRIRNVTVRNIARYHGAPAPEIEARMERLGDEWDLDRVMQGAAGAAILAGMLLARVDRRFLMVPAAAGAMLLQHALQGWCPAVPLLRRMGFRTRPEIHAEQITLRRMLRRG
jgi:hypothetical protein